MANCLKKIVRDADIEYHDYRSIESLSDPDNYNVMTCVESKISAIIKGLIT